MKDIELADPKIDPEKLFLDFKRWMEWNYPLKWVVNTYLVYMWYSEKIDFQDVRIDIEQWKNVRILCVAWTEIGLLRRTETNPKRQLEYYSFED